MPQTRELRTFASEVKFVVDSARAADIRRWARQYLDADPHGTGPHGDEYRTVSVYFDTEQLDVLHRRGSFGRCKYRIRRYDDGDQLFLERKLRRPGLLVKRRTAATLDALTRLSHPRSESSWSGHWFHSRLLVRRLHSVCQLSYLRTARVGTRNGETFRLTLDEDLRTLRADGRPFANAGGLPVIAGSLILELKYRREFPVLFRQLVEEFALNPQSVSKYRLGMIALGHVPGDLPVQTAVGPDTLYA